MSKTPDTPLDEAHRLHDRHWRRYALCYPVISRRSGGLSIGINLNPDKACNFDCTYCQVDRTTPAEIRKVDLAVLRSELESLLDGALDQSLFAGPPFDCLAPGERGIRDIAFSGDGEPTTCPQFDEAVRIAVEAKRARRLFATKLVLMTDACYLMKPKVRAALREFDENNGEIWAKLDAGTQAYFEKVNRPNVSLAHVIENITDAARVRPIVIQSLWAADHGSPPPDAEICAFSDRLNEISRAGGRIKLVQIHTIARAPAQTHVSALSRGELDGLAARVRASIDAPVDTYYGSSG